MIVNYLPNLINNLDKINNHIFFDFLLEISFKLDISNYVIPLVKELCKKIEMVNFKFFNKKIFVENFLLFFLFFPLDFNKKNSTHF